MDRTFGVAVLLLVGVATAVRTPGDEKGLFARTHAKGLVAAKAESLPPALLQSNEREAGELEDDGGWGSTFTNFLGDVSTSVDDLFDSFDNPVMDAAGEKINEVAEDAKATIDAVVPDAVKKKVKDGVDAVNNKVDEVADKVNKKVDEVTDAAEKKIDEVRTNVQGRVDATKKKVADTKKKVKKEVDRAKEDIASYAEYKKKDLQEKAQFGKKVAKVTYEAVRDADWKGGVKKELDYFHWSNPASPAERFARIQNNLNAGMSPVDWAAEKNALVHAIEAVPYSPVGLVNAIRGKGLGGEDLSKAEVATSIFFWALPPAKYLKGAKLAARSKAAAAIVKGRQILGPARFRKLYFAVKTTAQYGKLGYAVAKNTESVVESLEKVITGVPKAKDAWEKMKVARNSRDWKSFDKAASELYKESKDVTKGVLDSKKNIKELWDSGGDLLKFMDKKTQKGKVKEWRDKINEKGDKAAGKFKDWTQRSRLVKPLFTAKDMASKKFQSMSKSYRKAQWDFFRSTWGKNFFKVRRWKKDAQAAYGKKTKEFQDGWKKRRNEFLKHNPVGRKFLQLRTKTRKFNRVFGKKKQMKTKKSIDTFFKDIDKVYSGLKKQFAKPQVKKDLVAKADADMRAEQRAWAERRRLAQKVQKQRKKFEKKHPLPKKAVTRNLDKEIRDLKKKLREKQKLDAKKQGRRTGAKKKGLTRVGAYRKGRRKVATAKKGRYPARGRYRKATARRTGIYRKARTGYYHKRRPATGRNNKRKKKGYYHKRPRAGYYHTNARRPRNVNTARRVGGRKPPRRKPGRKPPQRRKPGRKPPQRPKPGRKPPQRRKPSRKPQHKRKDGKFTRKVKRTIKKSEKRAKKKPKRRKPQRKKQAKGKPKKSKKSGNKKGKKKKSKKKKGKNRRGGIPE